MRIVALLAALVAMPSQLTANPANQLVSQHVVRPVADGMVYEGNTDRNYGSSPDLRVRLQSTSSYRSYLRFVVTGITGITSAKLRLRCTDDSPDAGRVHLASDNGFTESNLTWDRRPSLVRSLASLGTVYPATWVEVDVSSVVKGPGTFVFAVADGSTNSAYFSSREGTHPPELVLRTDDSRLQAAFSANPVAGDSPLTVAFLDQSTGTVQSWRWVFGDGNVSTLRNPVHTYVQDGVFDVTLTVADSLGSSTLFKKGLIQVDPPDVTGIWTSAAELQRLPASGAAWDALLREANQATGTPDLSDQDDDTDVRVLAKALAYARIGKSSYRDDVIRACRDAIGTEAGGETLALGRNLVSYVIAADLVDLPAQDDALFRTWLSVCLTEYLAGRTLRSTHEDRPNNWGTHAGASRIAAALYLGDAVEVDRCAQVFKGWLGDRATYSAFDYGELYWQNDSSRPVGINPVGATRNGHSIDGVLPDDQRRAGAFSWPPPKENYVWEALQGALVQAVLLDRAGYDAFNWENQALLRANRWLHDVCDYEATGDDTWQPHVINHYYGTSFPAPNPSSPGKNVGFTDWTHPPN